MKSSTPKIAQKARLLLQSGDGVSGCCTSITASSLATALKASANYATCTPAAAAAAKAPPPGTPPLKPAQLKQPAATVAASTAPGAAPAGASAAQAATSPAGQPPAAAAAAGGEAGAGGPSGGDGKKGSSWLTMVALVGVPAGAYYVYDRSKSQYMQDTSSPVPERSKVVLPESIGSIVNNAKQAVSGIVPPQLSSILGASPTADKLQKQKEKDAGLGFQMLPPEGAVAEAAAAATDATAAAGSGGAAAPAAASDSMSAAADEFPGTSAATAEQAQKGPFADAHIEHVDMAPINALFSEVSKTDLTALAADSSSSSSSSTGRSSSSRSPEQASEDASRIVAAMSAVAVEQKQQQMQAAATPAPAAAADTPSSAAAATIAAAADHVESELVQLCRQLGIAEDLVVQVAQWNQASADAALLTSVLQQMAARQLQLQQQLAEARKEKDWADEAAKKREESLTERFKELMQEQSRIQQQLTAAAVREAEEAVMADTAAAHNEERRQRGKALDELRAKVNALTLAFDQRTAQVKSAHEVHKISLGVLALSKALEEGRPIGDHLLNLAAGCPGDPVVEAVAASLPPTAATSGLPTLQQLQQQFKEVAQQAAEATYFTADGEGGVLARLTAKLAVKLKVDAGSEVDSSPDSKISQARALLQQGKLLAAADALSAAATGTQAAEVVQQWVESARARAVADQAVRLLQAHATTTAIAART